MRGPGRGRARTGRRARLTGYLAAVPAGLLAAVVPAVPAAAATYTVTATITVGSHPFGVGADSSTGTIYVANQNGNTVSVIDGATNTGPPRESWRL